MMGKSYQRKTRRSKRKMQSLRQGTVSVETADGQARFQMVLPMNLLFGLLSLKLRVAWEMTDYEQARQELHKVHDWLASINLAAAQSLEEGFEETLTINRLNLSPPLRRLLASTNIIESCLSRVGDGCRNVTRWRDANMARRWVGAVLLEAEGRFHRVQGYQAMPLLIQALGQAVDTQEAVA